MELPRGQSATGRTEGLCRVLRLRWPPLPPPLQPRMAAALASARLPWAGVAAASGMKAGCAPGEGGGGSGTVLESSPGLGGQPAPAAAMPPIPGLSRAGGGQWTTPGNHGGPLNPSFEREQGGNEPSAFPDWGGDGFHACLLLLQRAELGMGGL